MCSIVSTGREVSNILSSNYSLYISVKSDWLGLVKVVDTHVTFVDSALLAPLTVSFLQHWRQIK